MEDGALSGLQGELLSLGVQRRHGHGTRVSATLLRRRLRRHARGGVAGGTLLLQARRERRKVLVGRDQGRRSCVVLGKPRHTHWTERGRVVCRTRPVTKVVMVLAT
ncbi:hypothetical protein E2C01_041826 [Portunus trituberculatus]|uniref:Uncharacterized protein n=1 Tax=Portunus trituberculatus TaxID=210409 RepID=A0A5B7FKW0_PORTR|nr:hypothetical protein [Portunus trituberculatus]